MFTTRESNRYRGDTTTELSGMNALMYVCMYVLYVYTYIYTGLMHVLNHRNI